MKLQKEWRYTSPIIATLSQICKGNVNDLLYSYVNPASNQIKSFTSALCIQSHINTTGRSRFYQNPVNLGT